MMAMTHALAGLLLATLVVRVSGGDPTPLVMAAVTGSVLPDLDIYAGHRETLHYPVMGWVPAGFAVALALAFPSTWTLALATFFVAFALHPVMDLYGGGLELRPWEARSEKAVYSHYHKRWLKPRRLVPYDGSPRDLALAGAMGLPALTLPEPVPPLVVVTVAVSAGYVVLRKRLAAVWSSLARAVPPRFRQHVPERFYE
ncbi:metal-dependent hydrolase [Haloarchaeobius sp. TZWWS8]|uniref:metal-dependent hydrolase n=1 Tax=Haloarchaeobius sp. TZWWS8 TaxID=3446121 RepID=UPI003EBA3233